MFILGNNLIYRIFKQAWQKYSEKCKAALDFLSKLLKEGKYLFLIAINSEKLSQIMRSIRILKIFLEIISFKKN